MGVESMTAYDCGTCRVTQSKYTGRLPQPSAIAAPCAQMHIFAGRVHGTIAGRSDGQQSGFVECGGCSKLPGGRKSTPAYRCLRLVDGAGVGPSAARLCGGGVSTSKVSRPSSNQFDAVRDSSCPRCHSAYAAATELVGVLRHPKCATDRLV